MRDINPMAVLIISIATVIGALAGAWLVGLLVGLVFVLIATVVNP